MEKRKNPLVRLLLVGHMLEIIRLELEHHIEGNITAACRNEIVPEQIESLGFCCSLAALLENTQALLCESLDDPEIAALAPHRQSSTH